MQRETPRQGSYETLSNERPYDMIPSEKAPSVKAEQGVDSAPHTHPRFRLDRATRKCTKRLNVLSEAELRVLDAMAKWLGYGWAPRVGKDEVRLSSSVIAECARMSRSRVIAARASLVKKDILVQTSPAVEGQYIPATYRVAINVLEDLLAKAGAPDSAAMVHQAKSGQDEPPVSQEYTGQSPTGTPPSLPRVHRPVSDRYTLSTYMDSGVGSPVGERAASAALPYGQSLPGGEDTPEQVVDLATTEEPESSAPPVHLATAVQEGPTGSRVPGRLSAASGSSWVLTDEEKPASVVRVKKSSGKKTPKPAPASPAGSSGVKVPPARPQTSVRSTPRALPASGPDPLSVRTPFSAPVGAPAPRTVPPYPSVTAVWSGNAAGASPPFSPDEYDFLTRYETAQREVSAAQKDLYAKTKQWLTPTEDESLGDACAAAFTKHFPRGYSAELLAFKASRTLAMKAAHAIHEAAEARRRAREAEEEALAERAHKKKKSA